MLEKTELKDLVDKLVDKFDLQAISKDGLIDGDVLKDKLTEFIYSSTKESLDSRKKKFIENIAPYVDEYGKELCNVFFRHWSKTKQGGWKMAWEKEKSFVIKDRLDTFKRNNIKFNTINLLNNLKTK